MEELKLVLEALTTLGAAGKEAFIWWLVFDKLIPATVALVAIVLCANAVFRLISAMSDNQGARLRDLMGVGSSGPMIKSEWKEMAEWIVEHKKQK